MSKADQIMMRDACAFSGLQCDNAMDLCRKRKQSKLLGVQNKKTKLGHEVVHKQVFTWKWLQGFVSFDDLPRNLSSDVQLANSYNMSDNRSSDVQHANSNDILTEGDKELLRVEFASSGIDLDEYSDMEPSLAHAFLDAFKDATKTLDATC